jgi:hypothetical protein
MRRRWRWVPLRGLLARCRRIDEGFLEDRLGGEANYKKRRLCGIINNQNGILHGRRIKAEVNRNDFKIEKIVRSQHGDLEVRS